MLNIVFWFVVRKCVCNSVIDNFRAELMAASDEPGPEPEIDIEEAGHGEGEVVHLDENVTPDEDEGDTPLASSGGSGVEELPDLPDLSHDDEVAELLATFASPNWGPESQSSQALGQPGYVPRIVPGEQWVCWTMEGTRRTNFSDAELGIMRWIDLMCHGSRCDLKNRLADRLLVPQVRIEELDGSHFDEFMTRPPNNRIGLPDEFNWLVQDSGDESSPPPLPHCFPVSEVFMGLALWRDLSMLPTRETEAEERRVWMFHSAPEIGWIRPDDQFVLRSVPFIRNTMFALRIRNKRLMYCLPPRDVTLKDFCAKSLEWREQGCPRTPPEPQSPAGGRWAELFGAALDAVSTNSWENLVGGVLDAAPTSGWIVCFLFGAVCIVLCCVNDLNDLLRGFQAVACR